jgi:hypothetical protein
VVDEPEQAAKDPSHQAACDELVLESASVVLAPSHLAVDANDVEQHQQVQDPDQDQESARDDGSDRSADAAQLTAASHHPLHDPLDRQAERDRDEEDNRRVPEREKESDADRFASALEQLASGVVDRRDVVRVEGVTQAERVRQTAERQKTGMAGAVQKQQSPTRHMQGPDPAEETGQASPLTAIEGLGQRPYRGHGEQPNRYRDKVATVSSKSPIFRCDFFSSQTASVQFGWMTPEHLPPQLSAVLRALNRAVETREPAIRAKVEHLRAEHPLYTHQQLARELIRSTRRRVAATGALSGAVSIAPGLGTVLAVGTVTSQSLYALEQEVELVLGIAMIFGHELNGSDERVLEALVVIGLAGGALKLREVALVAGGERLAMHLIAGVLSKTIARRATRIVGRVIPLGVGVAVGAGFDWVAVSGLGRAAIRYYGPGGPGAKPLLLAPEDPSDVELGG